jgi:hypothetical protein
MNNDDYFRRNRNMVIYSTPGHPQEQGHMPVSHWLQDLDMLKMLKNVYYGWRRSWSQIQMNFY